MLMKRTPIVAWGTAAMPTKAPEGARFINLNTGDEYEFIDGAWRLLASGTHSEPPVAEPAPAPTEEKPKKKTSRKKK